MKKEPDKDLKIMQGILIGTGLVFILALIFLSGQEQARMWENYPLSPYHYSSMLT